jgi:DNA polymerase-3 subunit epsilon
VPTGRRFHHYVNPERAMPVDAHTVHGLTDSFLQDQPIFADICESFLEFIGDASIIMHNAAFDLAFLNAEFSRAGSPPIPAGRIIDTLELARTRHPMAPNSLDALCRRYDIDAARREKHGALLDAELLTEIYIELIGGKQPALMLAATAKDDVVHLTGRGPARARPTPLPERLTESERLAHEAFIASLGAPSLWRRGRASSPNSPG